MKLFPPQPYHAIPSSSTIFNIFWRCSWMFSCTFFSKICITNVIVFNINISDLILINNILT